MTPASYDAIASWYDSLVRSGSLAGDIVVSHLLELVGNVTDQEICDLACGQGRIARVLAQAGAQVTGVDLSTELIAIARRDEVAEPSGAHYVVDDAQTLASIPDERFHGVVCNLALMDIPDLNAALNAVWRVLRPGGWFVFAITHPCFEAPHARWNTAPDGSISREVFTYFAEDFWRSSNPNGVRGQVGAHHRMISTYVNALVQAGFVIEQMIEPAVDAATPTPVEGYRVVPAFAILRCRKPESPRVTGL